MVKNLIRAPESLSVWESNIKEMRKYQPSLATVLELHVRKYGHDFEHWENDTASGAWIDGLTSKPFFQSGEEPEFPWDKKKDKTTPTFFLYGVGAPPFLFRTIRSLPHDALSLIVIEPNIRLLAYTLHLTHAYTAMREGARLTFYSSLEREDIPDGADRGENEEANKNTEEVGNRRDLAWKRLEKIMLGETMSSGLVSYGIYTAALSKSYVHPGEGEAMHDIFQKIFREIKEWVSVSLSTLGNAAEDTLLGLRQMALMTPWILNGGTLKPLADSHRGRPFVCVAAGPSLDKNLHLLKDVQDKCVILVADTVLRKLLVNGIRPHMVSALERGIETYECFFAGIVEEFPDECAQILLVAQSVCAPQITGRWPGPKVVIGKRGLPLDEWFNGAILQGDLIPSGASVAHVNYGVAHMMGASSVALIGQDLAFGEDGSTHAGDTAREDIMDITKRSTQRNKIPGAMGGEVETEHIWLMFLRVLEQLINQLGIETWDCTEGGALIAGTQIQPLSRYLEEKVDSLEPFTSTLASLVAEAKREPDQDLDARFQHAFDGISRSRALLDEVEAHMVSVSAAGISPQKRVDAARRADRTLDALYRQDAALAFIGQSYVYLASMELAETRLLDSVETVERWEKMHREILEGDRLSLDFMDRWLRYADAARKKIVDESSLLPIPQEEAEERFRTLLTEGAEDAAFETDLLLARCDLLRTDATGYALWGAAAHLMTEGRAQEALAHMSKAAERFDDREMPKEDIVRFFKDYARIVASHDLCHYPNYQMAEILIANALELAPADPECQQILGEILDGRLSLSATVMGDGSGKWLTARAVGARALAEGNLVTALQAIWIAIKDHWKSVPGWAGSHLHWLTGTLAQVQNAEDPLIRAAVQSIASEIAADTELLEAISLVYSAEVGEMLKAHGAQCPLRIIVEEVPCVAEEVPEEVL